MLKIENKNISIGGQAVIEGVMMKSPNKISMSVRLPNGEIDNECWNSDSNNKWYNKTPIIRGFINFICMMVLGYKCLMKSVEKTEIAENCLTESKNKKNKLELFLGDYIFKIIMTLSTVFGIVISVFLFMWVPSFMVKLATNVIKLSPFIKSLLEGIIKIIIFISYISITSLMAEMKTLYKYHGAEHKSISCYEHGEELTIENVKKHTRFHPRCGTSFILIVLVIGILVFSCISWENILIRVFTKLALLPLVVGVSYELIKINSKYNNKITKFFVAPGLWLQKITTKEPTSEQIEVAIDALKNAMTKNNL